MQVAVQRPEDPRYPAEDLYGIVGDNLKKSFDVKEVSEKQKSPSCLAFIVDAIDRRSAKSLLSILVSMKSEVIAVAKIHLDSL